MAHPTKMSAHDTGLLVIDMQEKLIPKILAVETVVRNIAFLVDGAKLLGMPVQASEQYPKGLGATVPELACRIAERPDKLAFSCAAIPTIVDNFQKAGCSRLVLAGIETHVCVLQTALDYLALGLKVYIPVDAVGSRYAIDHEAGLRRLEAQGAILTTSEMCVFEWVGGAANPQFKAISRLVQDRMKAIASQA